MPKLRLEYIPAGDINKNPRNWRTHPPDQMEAIKTVLADVGWAGALLYNERTKRLVDGHARLDAVEPEQAVPVLVGDWSEAEEAKILATLDTTAYMATVDRTAMESLLKDVPLEDGLAPLGKLLTDLGRKGALKVNPGKADADAAPEPPSAAVTQPGDLIRLGSHRLVCGPCEGSLGELLGGEQVHMVHADPPYNVAVEPRSNRAITAGKSSFAGEKKDSRKLRPKDRAIANDALTPDEFAEQLQTWFTAIAQVLQPGGAFYFWGGYANITNYPQALAASGLRLSQTLIWVKGHPVVGRKDFMGNHEWCFYGWREGAAHRFFERHNVSDTWEVKKVPSQQTVHLTQKPVELARRALSCSSQAGDLVLDTFGGSGTTLIACEELERSCRMVELDPLYCDVIVERWEKFTGKKAKRPRRRKARGA